jgi:hypothetical protein
MHQPSLGHDRGARALKGCLTKRAPSSYVVKKLKRELLGEVVFERKLDVNIVGREIIEKVLSFAPDQLGANHYVVSRIEQQVTGTIVTAMERVWRLPVRIRDIQHRISDRAAEALIPCVVQIAHYSGHR